MTIVSSRKVNINANFGGGNKKQGLAPKATFFFKAPFTGSQYDTESGDGKDRNLVLCMNQLSGVGRGRSQFSSSSDGINCINEQADGTYAGSEVAALGMALLVDTSFTEPQRTEGNNSFWAHPDQGIEYHLVPHIPSNLPRKVIYGGVIPSVISNTGGTVTDLNQNHYFNPDETTDPDYHPTNVMTEDISAIFTTFNDVIVNDFLNGDQSNSRNAATIPWFPMMSNASGFGLGHAGTADYMIAMPTIPYPGDFGDEIRVYVEAYGVRAPFGVFGDTRIDYNPPGHTQNLNHTPFDNFITISFGDLATVVTDSALFQNIWYNAPSQSDGAASDLSDARITDNSFIDVSYTGHIPVFWIIGSS